MQLVLFSRKNCSLCDVFESELAAFLKQENITAENDEVQTYEIKDVDSNATWQQQYGNDVPVLLADEALICQHFFDKEKVLSALG